MSQDKIVKLNDISVNGSTDNHKELLLKLNKAISQSEYGKSFCLEYYNKDYIEGLIDTVNDDYKYSLKILAHAKKALHSKSINVKNKYLRSMNNINFDDFVGYDSVSDANYDIKHDIHNEYVKQKQLKEYTPDTVVELSGSIDNCVHPLEYSRIKHFLKYDYMDY